MEFSKFVCQVEPSATLAITSKAKAMRANGEDVIILAAGEPDHDTPEKIKEAAIEAIKKGVTKYTPASGTLSLKKTICTKLKRDNGLDYDTSQIVVSNGAKHSIFNVLKVICNPGDEVLIVPPYWLSYSAMAKLVGAVPKILPVKEDNGFKVTRKIIEDTTTEKTKVIIINSPSNPAGIVFSKEELKEIADVCLEKGIMIISDEIYEKIIFDNKEHFSIASISDEVKEATIVVNGVSKSYSMTGWRIGYIACKEEIAKLVSTFQSHATSNPCSVSQVAAEYAISNGMEEEMKKNKEKFQERRNFILKSLENEDKIKPIKPEGAFYMFCNIKGTGMDSLTFSQKLLEEEKVAVIPGGPFGCDDYVRISFATDLKTIEEGLNRIKKWVNKK